jgi:hypothetical protein
MGGTYCTPLKKEWRNLSATENSNGCNMHSGVCVNIDNLTRELSSLKDDLENFKTHTTTKLDDMSRLYHDINDKITRIEIIITEKLRNIEDKFNNKKSNTALLVGQFVYPLLVALVLYFTFKKW